MATTYEAISTQTLPSGASSVTFSGIPNTYTDLVLIDQSFTASGSSHCFIQFNGDTGNNYSLTALIGSGTSTSSARYTNQGAGFYSRYANSNDAPTGITYIGNYSNTSTYKTILSRGNVPTGITLEYVNLWRSTAAINSVKIFPNGASYVAGATFTLYGIKAA